MPTYQDTEIMSQHLYGREMLSFSLDIMKSRHMMSKLKLTSKSLMLYLLNANDHNIKLGNQALESCAKFQISTIV